MRSLVVIAVLAGAAPSTAQTQTKADPKRVAVQEVDRFSAEIGGIAGQLWTFSETALRETRSAALLADLLEREGFRVERGVAGMPPAFVATWGSGRPVIGILAEYDALPGGGQRDRPPEAASRGRRHVGAGLRPQPVWRGLGRGRRRPAADDEGVGTGRHRPALRHAATPGKGEARSTPWSR